MIPIPSGPIGEAIVKKYFVQEGWEEVYLCCTTEMKSISEYTGLSFKEVLELPYSLYLLYRREAWIYGIKRYESGRELLKTIWRLQQTEADTTEIRAFNNRKG